MRNYTQFYAICKKLGLHKKDIVLYYTEGRTSSLTSLDDQQWEELLIRIKKLQPVLKNSMHSPGDKQRKKLMAIAGKMHWGKTNMAIIKKLNDFLLHKYKKNLNELHVSELNKIVWVFENQIYKDFLNKL